MSVINVDKLSVSYGQKRVLTNIDLSIESGTLNAVLGPNGAGKSTLFKAILGLVEPTSGKIEINGASPSSQKKSIAYVPQKSQVEWTFPATVLDIVMMGRYPFKKLFSFLNKEDEKAAEVAMDKLDILHLKARQIGELSGGQQQRVFIARAMCQNAEILMLDEPLVGVDIKTERKIISTLKRLAAEGKTILVVHHDLLKVREYFDHVLLLNQELTCYGKTETAFTTENINKAYIAQLNILP